MAGRRVAVYWMTGSRENRDENEQTFLALRAPNFNYENSSLLVCPPYIQPPTQSIEMRLRGFMKNAQ
jgi:hypothetical protein